MNATISQEISSNVQSQILDKFLEGNPKELFKVWHFIYNKGYDYNTEEGLKKYKSFKKNLMEIRATNSDPSNSWKAGLSEHSDFTFEEFSEFFGIKQIDVQQIKADVDKVNKIKGFTLDDYNDDNETFSSPSVQAPTLYDYRSNSLAVRNQGSCNSCWAFATMGQLENAYWAKYKSTAGAVNQYLSVQQLVDCNTTSSGCSFGYPSEAINYLQTYNPMTDASYTYSAVKSTCKYSSTNISKVKVTGIKYGGSYYYSWYPVSTLALLANGPVVVLVGVNSSFTYYKSGIFSSACSSGVNHSVLLIGYGYDSVTAVYYYIVRNSWGSTWGESGYIRIKDDGVACSIPIYAFQGVIA
jgi:C1A family cysteine protease